ncbi:uncharacterized protein MONBRDRAFT_11143 [Monosiga brevicollis MX1]|uniref:Uncharacterized protein n=1 Tax=Monosiga brevicollis TaxID=81824 RepID=A9V8B8_MONBE|nr:uncharacterized protein MONBRDRAFT_11143 [Monosiga brevicollis MX1]EDQ86310.1 predicted protein [Monosiga brevicollis MX1]|eukprot:XP_001748980.1 hypothetical protein [Monosiga brevicollis MX1]
MAGLAKVQLVLGLLLSLKLEPWTCAVSQEVELHLDLNASLHLDGARDLVIQDKKILTALATLEAQVANLTARLPPDGIAVRVDVNDTVHVESNRPGQRVLFNGVDVLALEARVQNAESQLARAAAAFPGALVPAINVIGGRFSDRTTITSVERLVSPTAGWQRSTPTLPGIGLVAMAAVTFRGQVYLLGGFDGNKSVSTVHIYNGVTFETGPPLPQGRFGAAAAVHHDSIYLMGGREGSCTASVLLYNGRAWLPAPNLDEQRCSPSAAVFRDQLYVLGGWTGTTFLNTVVVLSDGAWIETAPMLVAARARSVAVFQDSLYVLGGGIDADVTTVTSVESFNGTTWVFRPCLPTPRESLAAVAWANQLFAIGGVNDDKATDAVHVFNGTAWSVGPSLLTPRNFPVVVLYPPF